MMVNKRIKDNSKGRGFKVWPRFKPLQLNSKAMNFETLTGY